MGSRVGKGVCLTVWVMIVGSAAPGEAWADHSRGDGGGHSVLGPLAGKLLDPRILVALGGEEWVRARLSDPFAEEDIRDMRARRREIVLDPSLHFRTSLIVHELFEKIDSYYRSKPSEKAQDRYVNDRLKQHQIHYLEQWEKSGSPLGFREWIAAMFRKEDEERTEKARVAKIQADKREKARRDEQKKQKAAEIADNEANGRNVFDFRSGKNLTKVSREAKVIKDRVGKLHLAITVPGEREEMYELKDVGKAHGVGEGIVYQAEDENLFLSKAPGEKFYLSEKP